MAYGTDIRNEAKRLFIEAERAPAEISKELGGNPVAQTILNWATTPDEDGKTWRDLRQERADRLYEEMTPEAMARQMMEQMQEALANRDADSLAKIAKVFRQIVDPKYRLGMTYNVLSRFMVFCADHHPELLQSDLADAARAFKDQERARLQ